MDSDAEDFAEFPYWDDSDDPGSDGWPEGSNVASTTYAQMRRTDRTYASKSFRLGARHGEDFGQPARFVSKVFDPEQESIAEYDGSEWVLRTSPKGRYQVRLLVAREAGSVRELWIERVPAPGLNAKEKLILNLQKPEAERLVELLRNLDLIPIEGERSIRVDDLLLRELLESPESLSSLYSRDPEAFRSIMAGDSTAEDLVATAHRRDQVSRFRELLTNTESFDNEVRETKLQRAEDVWRGLFEANPWMLGVSLTGQLLTSWSKERLEQVTAGFSILGPGKRPDAVLKSNGLIRSMVFAEIKTHRTNLLSRAQVPDRSGCWAPHGDLCRAVAQVQGTVHRALMDIGDRLPDKADDGSEMPGEFTYLVRPRSFLIVGCLSELRGYAGGDHLERIRSFELYRRSLMEPEIITFDELLARAEWIVNIEG